MRPRGESRGISTPEQVGARAVARTAPAVTAGLLVAAVADAHVKNESRGTSLGIAPYEWAG